MKVRKYAALALCLVLVLSLCTGCQKPMDAQTLVTKMNEAIGGRAVTSMLLTMDMDITLKSQGMSMDMGMDILVGIKQNETQSYTDMEMTMELLGIHQEVHTKGYTSLEDGKYVSYTYTDIDDSWTRIEADEIPADETAFTGYEGLADLDPAGLTLDEETQLLDEREVYVLRATLTGDMMKKSFFDGMEAMGEDLDEVILGMMEGIDFSAMQIPAVFYIDKETFLPVKVEMQVEGLGQVMNAVMASTMESLAGMSLEELDVTVDVPLCTIVSEGIRFDEVEVPTVPAEGVEAALAALPPADGVYTLTCDDNTVKIRLPEGFTVTDSTEYYLYFVNEDYTVFGEYSLLYQNEDQVLSYIDDEEAYATENEYFVSRSEIGEYGPFKTAQINYTEGMVDYYAWREIECGVLDVMVSVMDENASLSLDALLDCVDVSVG